MRASVQHFEIPARDPERAARFYREVFGWSVERLEWEGPPYFRIRPRTEIDGLSRQGIDGGITAGGQAGEQPLLVLHLEDATLEECLARITAAGGSVDREPTEVGGMGRFARFLDPEGNRLGLWQRA
jgi:uncharacterized protein